MVPNGWENTRLKNIAKIKSGSTPLRSKQDLYYSKDGTPWIKTLDLNNSDILTTDEKITDLALQETSCSVFPINTVLVAMYGGFNQIGRTGLIGVPSAINQALSALVLNEEKALPRYVLNYLNGNVKQWKKFAASSRKDPNITREDVCSFEILLPPLPEQRKIAKILSTWDNAISTTERLIDNSKQQKKALMQQLLTGKKRLLDDSGKPFEGEFDRVNLSELATIDKSSLGKKTPEDFEFSYISLSDVKTGKIADNLEKHVFSSSPSRARRKVSCGDILLATVRPNLKGFAKVKAEHDGMIASTGFSVLTPKKGVSGDYLYHYLFSCHITGQINALVVGSNYPAINSSDVSGLKVYIPSYDEQKKVASVLNNADQSLAQLEQQLADLKQEKKALMQQLLTGKRRVKVDDKEVA